MRVDLADIVDRNCYGEGQEYGLRFSSVMGATMTFYIRLIGKTKMHTILSSSEIDQYTYFALYLLDHLSYRYQELFKRRITS